MRPFQVFGGLGSITVMPSTLAERKKALPLFTIPAVIWREGDEEKRGR